MSASTGDQAAQRALLIVLLAHNEEASIATTLREVRSVLPTVDVLVVDDGSRDGTSRIAREAGALVVRHPINLGVAMGEATGLSFAVRQGYQHVVRMDGDGQHDARSVETLQRALEEGADLVIGSRYVGTASYAATGLRRLGGRFLCALLRVLTGLSIQDPTSGFRGFSRRAMSYFAATQPHDYPEPESVVMAYRAKLKVVEAPAVMRARKAGTSSISPLRAVFYMVKVSFSLVLERTRPGWSP